MKFLFFFFGGGSIFIYEKEDEKLDKGIEGRKEITICRTFLYIYIHI